MAEEEHGIEEEDDECDLINLPEFQQLFKSLKFKVDADGRIE